MAVYGGQGVMRRHANGQRAACEARHRVLIRPGVCLSRCADHDDLLSVFQAIW